MERSNCIICDRPVIPWKRNIECPDCDEGTEECDWQDSETGYRKCKRCNGIASVIITEHYIHDLCIDENESI